MTPPDLRDYAVIFNPYVGYPVYVLKTGTYPDFIPTPPPTPEGTAAMYGDPDNPNRMIYRPDRMRALYAQPQAPAPASPTHPPVIAAAKPPSPPSPPPRPKPRKRPPPSTPLAWSAPTGQVEARIKNARAAFAQFAAKQVARPHLREGNDLETWSRLLASKLGERNAAILSLLADGHTYKEAGAPFNLCGNRVGQIRYRARRVLLKAFENEGLTYDPRRGLIPCPQH